ncbi:hypothetical protein COX09_00840 [Candidatus Beckwithbacteria bacterium CG23_combo_of_CG06-09_8_20_14_all_47_9]|uniref:Uncharacterized protein n=1 Tax=Candidatus Beckwithbacteria bacterium CG23_combo_of_CG06-09_8_20_14_all_47_9 TaxID=1974498 RepID=A0A2H0B4H6_9BACT|nr:MAG: hypothetical protein COX09_00840 [Candidatus Beckwithbacteria bacterium CG23_combo_of_CG06-09_8_20_14_all_47_9]
MDQDIQSQLDRAKELLQELENACNTDLQAKDVSGKTKNLSQEVLLKVKHLLDQSIYKFFEKQYLPSLSDLDKKSAKVYFPTVSKKEDLKSVFGRAKMGDLETRHQDFYKFIESVQPYNQDYFWLKHLASYSSEKHIRLTPQIKTETKRVTVSRGGGSVSWGPGVTFGGGVSVMGVPIDPATQMPIPNNVAETKVENWVSFLFEGSDVNVLGLCKKSVEDGEKIIKKVLEFV